MSIRAVILVAFCAISTYALPFVSSVFNSNAVLQSERPIPLWGWDTLPNARISATFNNASYHTYSSMVAEPDGFYFWKITMPPQKVSFEPAVLTIQSSSSLAEKFSDILIGDVYLCSGQSNAQMSVRPLLVPHRHARHGSY
jgi:sialate O-acetylesterase